MPKLQYHINVVMDKQKQYIDHYDVIHIETHEVIAMCENLTNAETVMDALELRTKLESKVLLIHQS